MFGAYENLRHGADELQASASLINSPSDWTPPKLDRADQLRVHAVDQLESAVRSLAHDPLVWSSGLVPSVNDQPSTIEDLGRAGILAGSAEGRLITAARAFGAEKDAGNGPFGDRVLQMLANAQPTLSAADSDMKQALQLLDGDLQRALSPPLRAEVVAAQKQFQNVEDRISRLAGIALSMPAALGLTAPKTYLVIMANPAELRPAGGLAGYLGPITFNKGNPTELGIRNYAYYNPLFKQCFPIPSPLVNYLRYYNNCFELGDATWSPDFPTSAQLVESMYASATGRSVDGTISIDPYAVSAILTVTGAVADQKYGEFTAENVFDKVDVLVNVDSSGNTALNTDVIPRISAEVLAKLQSLPASLWPKVADVLADQAAQRHVQFYLHDPTLQGQAAAAGFDGSVRSAGSDDYLLVDDANIHVNKADRYMTKSADLKVEIYPSGINRHELTLTYDYPMPAQPSASDRALNLDNQYYDYMRVYLPDTSTQSSILYFVDGQPAQLSLGEISHEFGKTVIGLTFILRRGHKGQIKILYSDALDSSRGYRLYLQRQAGIPDRPTKVEVSYPGGIASRQFDLRYDTSFQVNT